jgi:hypothetical protein
VQVRGNPTKWTIAILTVPEREVEFTRMIGMLERQIQDRHIEILVDDSPDPVSVKRQRCLEAASGEYFSFVDDDDIVAHDFIATIYPLLDGVDYIGFRMQYYDSGLKHKPTMHSLVYEEWREDSAGYYRNVSHLNPIRTELARTGSFSGGYGEDKRWADMVKPEREYFIDRPMYFYFFSRETTIASRK